MIYHKHIYIRKYAIAINIGPNFIKHHNSVTAHCACVRMCSILSRRLCVCVVNTATRVKVLSGYFRWLPPLQSKVAGEWLALMIHTWGVPGHISIRTPTILTEGFRGFPQWKVKQSRYMPWRERRYNSYSYLTSALDGCEWSTSRPGRALPPRKEPPVPIGQEGPRAGLDAGARRKTLCLCQGSNPGRPVRTQTLYWLSYPGSGFPQYFQKNTRVGP
jgi:hypothetical protein